MQIHFLRILSTYTGNLLFVSHGSPIQFMLKILLNIHSYPKICSVAEMHYYEDEKDLPLKERKFHGIRACCVEHIGDSRF